MFKYASMLMAMSAHSLELLTLTAANAQKKSVSSSKYPFSACRNGGDGRS